MFAYKKVSVLQLIARKGNWTIVILENVANFVKNKSIHISCSIMCISNPRQHFYHIDSSQLYYLILITNYYNICRPQLFQIFSTKIFSHLKIIFRRIDLLLTRSQFGLRIVYQPKVYRVVMYIFYQASKSPCSDWHNI